MNDRAASTNGRVGKPNPVFRWKGYDRSDDDDLVGPDRCGQQDLYASSNSEHLLRALRAYAERKALAAKALLSPTTLRDSLAGFLARRRRSGPRGFARISSRVRRAARGRRRGPAVPEEHESQPRRHWWNATSATGSSRERSPSNFPVAARASQVLDLSRGLTIIAQIDNQRKRFSGMPRKRLTWWSFCLGRPAEGRAAAPGKPVRFGADFRVRWTAASWG